MTKKETKRQSHSRINQVPHLYSSLTRIDSVYGPSCGNAFHIQARMEQFVQIACVIVSPDSQVWERRPRPRGEPLHPKRICRETPGKGNRAADVLGCHWLRISLWTFRDSIPGSIKSSVKSDTVGCGSSVYFDVQEWAVSESHNPAVTLKGGHDDTFHVINTTLLLHKSKWISAAHLQAGACILLF